MLNENLQLSDIKEEASKGLRWSSVTLNTLGQGETVYRFADSGGKKRDRHARKQHGESPWWIREKDYKLILRHHREGKLSLGLAARFALAVQQVYRDPQGRAKRNRMDILVKAQAVQDVRVAVGRAKTQRGEQAPNGIYLKWPGDPEIEQMFIPGLESGTGILSIDGEPALRVLSRNPRPSTQLY